MKNLFKINPVLGSIIIVGLAMGARANPVNVYTMSDLIQDDWGVNGWVEELGQSPPFPTGEQITATTVTWEGHVPCPVSPSAWAVQIRMTNLTGRNWGEVYYVADPETSLANMDEWVGQVGNPTWGMAFKIDSYGENTPLVYESMIADNVFQAGETWEFVIQQYANSLGGPPAAFNSLGVAGASAGWPPSTGSIIVIPEPAAFSLLALGALAMLWRKRS